MSAPAANQTTVTSQADEMRNAELASDVILAARSWRDARKIPGGLRQVVAIDSLERAVDAYESATGLA